uniref:ABC transporter ATP-binding protein n=1 Tax=Ndongobacter massiliensis TaxID=1871025 RepID=UPI0009316F1C|nr:ABC transporter ATP-binding protein [Ndongobacter massiliensis]
MRNDALFSVEGLHFSYGNRPVLRGVNLSIVPNKITTLLGANGSGKTTLFRLMTRSLSPESGKIMLKGKNLSQYSIRALSQQVAIVQQQNHIIPDLTVHDFVSYGRTPYQTLFSRKTKKDEEMIAWALQVTDLEALGEQEMGKLSGGQLQRAWIAMAVAQGTQILFLDEPTTYLDLKYQIEILELIQRLNQNYGLTVIMVLHDVNQATVFSDRVIGLREGSILFDGAPNEMISTRSLEQLYGICLDIMSVGERKYVIASNRGKPIRQVLLNSM